MNIATTENREDETLIHAIDDVVKERTKSLARFT